MEIERSIFIAKPISDVFAFVSEPANDPEWCGKLISVSQVEGGGPGPGARYRVIHRPVPMRPPRTMDYRCIAWDPPQRIDWSENDGADLLRVTYTLEEMSQGVRFTQHDHAELGVPAMLHPFMRLGISHDIASQLRNLKRILEA